MRTETIIARAASEEEIAAVRALFKEYAASLSFSLDFQNFDLELASLPGAYAPPSGTLLFARVAGQPAGCVAVRRFNAEAGELKRLFVRPSFRGAGLGRALTVRAIDEARETGYARLRLDTVDSMTEAQSLYLSLGFERAKPWRINPPEAGESRCMELDLRRS